MFFAAEDEDVVWDVSEGLIDPIDLEYNITFGISDQNPDLAVVPFGVNRPDKVWNIAKKGKYNFAGVSGGADMYTNYKFTGKTSYTIKVNNRSKKPIEVTAKRLLKTYASTKVSGKKSATIQFSNIKHDTEFYIVFEGKDQDFDGYIK